MSKSPSLRRIQADIRELALDPSDRYHAAPLENDMFEWHFTIRGADGTDFEGGVYHGRILLPPEYPFKPPHIVFLTPSGRFETNTKVCLSFSAFHPELWQPAWGIRLILEALISFLPAPADGAIGSLNWSSEERKKLAKSSIHFVCPVCGGKVVDLLPKLVSAAQHPSDGATDSAEQGQRPSGKPSKPSRFQKEIEELQRYQLLEHPKEEGSQEGEDKDKPDAQPQPVTKVDDVVPSMIDETTETLNQPMKKEEDQEQQQLSAEESEIEITFDDGDALGPLSQPSLSMKDIEKDFLVEHSGKELCRDVTKISVKPSSETSDKPQPFGSTADPVTHRPLDDQTQPVGPSNDSMMDYVLLFLIGSFFTSCIINMMRIKTLMEELMELEGEVDSSP